MVERFKALRDERVVNIKELQKSPSRSLKGLTRILRGSQTLGYFLDTATFDEFIEDFEAQSSSVYKKRIAAARKDQSALSLDSVLKRYGS